MANASRSKIYIAFEANSIEDGYSAPKPSYTHVLLPQTLPDTGGRAESSCGCEVG